MPREAMPTLDEMLEEGRSADTAKEANNHKQSGQKQEDDSGEEEKIRRTVYLPADLDYRIAQSHLDARKYDPGLSKSEWISQLCEKGLEILEQED